MPSIEPYKDQTLPERFLRWIELLRGALAGIPDFIEGDGSPEGVVSARRGTRYFNRTGSAGSFLYVKTTTTGNTGWVAYGYGGSKDDIRLFGGRESAADNHQAIMDAITAVGSAYIPPGIWLSSPLTLASGNMIRGVGVGRSHLKLIEGLLPGNHLINSDGTTAPVLVDVTVDGNAAAYSLGENLTSVQYLNVTAPRFMRLGVTGGIAEGIYCYNSHGVIAREIEASNNGPIGGGDAAGIHLDNCDDYTVTGTANDNGFYGAFINNCGAGTVDLTTERNGVDGVRVFQSEGCIVGGLSADNANRGVYFNAATRCHYLKAVTKGNAGHGFVTFDAVDCSVDNIDTQGNGGYGISVEGASSLYVGHFTSDGNFSGELFEGASATVTRPPDFVEGDGSPEGVVTSRRGTRYFNRTGSAGSFLYVKTTTTGNTGWVAYG